MEATTCPNCKNDERIHFFGKDDDTVLVTRCGACDWRSEAKVKRLGPITAALQRIADRGIAAMF
jgi:Zn ribbon nucleic-acid-binding protein